MSEQIVGNVTALGKPRPSHRRPRCAGRRRPLAIQTLIGIARNPEAPRALQAALAVLT